jgi:glycosyltransferase involved in cell wall biosynthesis
MKILFITRLFYPHIGGVEKHVLEVGKRLKVKGKSVTILTEKYGKSLKDEEIVDGVKVIRFPHPQIKFLGLFFIWIWLFKNRKIILEADIIHVHDVFIWYLPFKFLYPKKSVFTTIHGLEWDRPFSKISIWQKRLAAKLSTGTVGVGKFLEEYLPTKLDLITYGASTTILYSIVVKKSNNSIVYVGRLEENTGLLQFIEWLKKNRNIRALSNRGAGMRSVVSQSTRKHGLAKSEFGKIDFCGDGALRKECEKYGAVHGFCDPTPYYKKAEYCVPGGYLAGLEALSYGCKLKLFWNNRVKEDYWKMSPFIRKDVGSWAKSQTWDKLADEYLDLYNHTK